MAKLTKMALFWRTFLVALIAGAPVATTRANASDASDWEIAKTKNTKEAYIWYLGRNPAGEYAEEAIDFISSDGPTMATIPLATRQLQMY